MCEWKSQNAENRVVTGLNSLMLVYFTGRLAAALLMKQHGGVVTTAC